MTHGICTACGRAFRTAQARIIAERRAAIIRDLKGIEPAEHMREWWEGQQAIDHAAARERAEACRLYRQTGNTEQDIAA